MRGEREVASRALFPTELFQYTASWPPTVSTVQCLLQQLSQCEGITKKLWGQALDFPLYVYPPLDGLSLVNVQILYWITLSD